MSDERESWMLTDSERAREIDRLRAEVVRLTEERDAAIKAMAEGQAIGDHVVDELWAWRARAESAEAALRELRTYVKHPSHECVPVCKCGLTELLRSLNAKA